MLPKLVSAGRWMLSDPYVGALGRMTNIYWTVWAVNIVQLACMVFGSDGLREAAWFNVTNTIGTALLILMLVARLSADYQDSRKAAPQAD